MKRIPAIAYLLLTVGLVASCGGENTDSNVEVPGGEKDTKSELLETGADILQDKSPLKKINSYLDGFHFYNGKPMRKWRRTITSVN